MKSIRRSDIIIILLLLVLPLLWFAPQVFGGRTLLPVDNLFQFEPWRHFAADFGVDVPQNPLISDLILENYAWKSLLNEALRSGPLTDILWNPRILGGSPFLAAGQQSALYPLSVVFYLLPLWLAYGVFTWLQLGVSAVNMYLLARVLGQRWPGALLAAIAFSFSGFFIASVNFTMIIAAASWLPLVLAMIEMILRKQEQKGINAYSPVPYVVAGALALGVQILAGHVEITYYVLMVSAFYAGWRLFGVWRRLGSWGPLLRLASWLVVMAGLGMAMGAVQLMPLYELVSQSFREGSASLQQVQDWAWPSRQIVTFLLPDAFGNPTHHTYFDIWERSWHPVTQNALGEPLNTIEWGVKNYVEGANYLGLITNLLAVIAAASIVGRRGAPVRQPVGHTWLRPPTGRFYIAGFVLLAILSLLFAFGTPLYALLYYLLPGYSQLHSAFRWVFPYTLSMALLAGFGLDLLIARSTPRRIRQFAGWTGIVALAAGMRALALVLASVMLPGPFVAMGDRLLASSDLARMRAFSDGAMAWSYEAVGLARFGLIAALSGTVLLLLSRRQHGKIWPLAAIVLLTLDLWLVGRGFNPAVDRRLLDFTPPAVQWLEDQQEDLQPWRLTSFDSPGDKTLNANAVMPYGLEDIRGYDSIIPRQYVGYMQRIQPQHDLLYNRIAPIYTQIGGQPNYDALDSPLLDLLGVRYVVTTRAIPNAGYELVYDNEVQIYENQDAFERAFIVPEARAAPTQAAALDLLATIDPREVVVLEGVEREDLPPAASPQFREVGISRRTNREIFLDANISDRAWLVYTDNHFPGWKAYLRPFGVDGEGMDGEGNSIEQELPIYRADGTFRAVYLPEAGQWTVRFVYSPRSILLGIYVTFLAGVIVLLLGGWWAWGRYYRGEQSEVGTVAKNSAVQVLMSLLSRGIDFAFAMLRMRVLSPAGEGSYAFAIAFYGVFEIITRFGLGTFLTRDVSLDRSQARRYLVNVVALRTGLWLVSLPLMLLMGLFYRVFLQQLSPAEAQAIALFAAALLFANIADAISAVFNAFEKMEYPAGIATAIAVAKVALGALVLLPPFDLGFVGLAGISLVMNLVQVVWLYVVLGRTVLRDQGGSFPRWKRDSMRRSLGARLGVDRQLQGHMLRESGPLMLNHLLASIFWRIDFWILKAFSGAAAVGIFSAGVKYLDGLNVIPSYFTLAVFPLMSRYAQAGTESLAKAYRVSVKLLFTLVVPVAVFVTFAAEPLIQILGGAAYLPDSAIALRIMIWSTLIGFINSVTQYVLIAVNRQRFLTRAFVLGVAFNLVANLIFVPRYGYLAAAVILIPAELSLFVPFAWAVHQYVSPMPWVDMLGRPLLAGSANAALVWILARSGLPLFPAILLGFASYALVLLALGAFRGEEFSIIRDRLPGLKRTNSS